MIFDETTNGRDTSSGLRYAQLVANYISARWGALMHVNVYLEVPMGTSLMGKARRVDILVASKDGGCALAIECKRQDVQGSAEDKIFYALADCRAMKMPSCLVWSGDGWSNEAAALLRADATAVRFDAQPAMQRTPQTMELDMRLAMTFGCWPAVLSGFTSVDANNSWAAVIG